MNLINAFEIDTPHGTKSVELCKGDITALEPAVDLLVVSAFQNEYFPVQGTVICALLERFNLDVAALRTDCEIDLTASLSTWLTSVSKSNPGENSGTDMTLPFQYLACVEMNGVGFDLDPLEHLVSNLFSTVGCALIRGYEIRSIAMPLLGTGSQGIPAEAVVPLLGDLCSQALRNLEMVEVIRFVERSDDKVRLIDQTLNDYLGRSRLETDPIAATESSYRDLQDRFTVDLGSIQNELRKRSPELEHPVAELRRVIESEEAPRFYQFAFMSRRFAEAVTMDVLEVNNLPNLVSGINQLHGKNISPWVISYLHLIRSFGNEAVHVNANEKARTPPSIFNEDVWVLLICVQRVTSFWRFYLKEGP